jgi:hypothetical protein
MMKNDDEHSWNDEENDLDLTHQQEKSYSN